MKKRSLFAALALFAITVAPHASFAGQKTVVLSVPDMNCSACPITVRKALEKVAGVQNVKATLEPPEASVTFDDAKTSIEKLTEATKRAGYPSSVKPGK
jgi:mercuric ion binding protein